MKRTLGRRLGALLGSALALVLAGTGSAHAATLSVPTGYPTITAAVEASQDGDLIQIAPGTYSEHLALVNRSLTFQGTGGAAATTIDGGGTDIIFAINGGTNAFKGLTLANGNANGLGGGAISIDTNKGAGGTVTVDACTFRDNRAGWGGAISLFARYSGISFTVSNSSFLNNRAESLDGGGSYGGAVYNSWGASFRCSNCRFEGNYSLLTGGAIYASLSYVSATDSVFLGNSAVSVGGAVTSNIGSTVNLDRCTLSGNAAPFGGAGYAGGSSIYWSRINAINSLLVGNTADTGGALAGGAYTALTIASSTIADNTAPLGGGLHLDAASSGGSIDNSIVYQNSSLSVLLPGTVSYSDIEGGFDGPGNIDAVPLFADPAGGDYTLAAQSPCIDAGGPGSQTLDLVQTPRPLGAGPDIGAYEHIPDTDADGFDMFHDCDDSNASIFPGAVEKPYDGVDQDCNGLDLTIRITKATWSKSKKSLAVEATSSYGKQAALRLPAYGVNMGWNTKRGIWTATVSGVASKPSSVAVSGPEGSVSAPVTEVK